MALTAHDFPSGHVADMAGIEIVLVGDSLAMVAMGLEDTSEVLIEEMLLHCRSVSRAVKTAFTVGDLPMGSYEISPNQALTSAIRLIKEGRVKAVKLEGGQEMAHSGKNSESALKILQDALALQKAGCFAIVIEAVPAQVATLITKELSVPTIGIGAGSGCSGQILVQVDMTGNFPPGRYVPKFVKTYCDVWGESLRGIETYREEVKSRKYPTLEHTYSISEEELAKFEKELAKIRR
ncbi:hypothetical protein EPUL_002351 [Erysiphe pulchra]|uniref:3-methyl-2-oxobutanoate hydroxymethyltransferase n=1 Tax=Erysiphe pulchra TaxID=225359 RepID=A0A2S4PQC1_9PEZI|nr:hypothetical protein EPUL_002351 [Erysiphe pulchra]